ncbi:DUF1826 domain-containing protein [Pseudophaeobacter sp.]|uniref:DUF1826 domain-containing protein n=1 Tax=Pseudophaeobacter sp. TaxID=1971739 RepID=UPI00329964A3
MSIIMETPLLHVRLEGVSTNARRRFHVDNMTAHLLCTYWGSGSELAQPGAEAAPLAWQRANRIAAPVPANRG